MVLTLIISQREQAFKKFSSGGGAQQQSSGGNMQSKLIGMAMAEGIKVRPTRLVIIRLLCSRM
jgi:hypothetical protein